MRLSLTLQAKIGSALVHAEEAISDKGHHFDLQTFKDLVADPDVAEWLEGLRKMAMLPVKR